MVDLCTGTPEELVRMPGRIVDVTWFHGSLRALVTTYDRATRVRTTYLVDAGPMLVSGRRLISGHEPESDYGPSITSK